VSLPNDTADSGGFLQRKSVLIRPIRVIRGLFRSDLEFLIRRHIATAKQRVCAILKTKATSLDFDPYAGKERQS
jgi:hypothetical protein